MPLKLGTDARRVVLRAARAEAQTLRSPTIEAEHLLLALAQDNTSPAAQLLADYGLDTDGIHAALERARERSLAAVSITMEYYSEWDDASLSPKDPKLATSAKQALVRAISVARHRHDSHISSTHLLIGILAARLGTVPRALEASGIDRVDLATQAEQLLK